MSRELLQQFIDAAQASQREYGVPASVTLAQFILESAWGTRHMNAHNYFGMKFSERRHKAYVTRPTREFSKERGWYTTTAKFASFDNPEESFKDHARLFAEYRRYSVAMYHKGDPNRFAEEIARAGYATDPKYADKLKTLMKTYDLYGYDVKE